MPGPIIAPNPAQNAQQQALFRQLASLPPDVRAFISEQYNSTQISVLPLPYWSTIRFAASRAAGPPVVLTIDTTDRKAFAYAQGQDMAIAGRSGATATKADTNLLKASETRDNSDIWIWGIAAYVTQDSEPVLAQKIWRETSVDISLNGTQSIPLGTLEMFPSAGGLYGATQSNVLAGPTNVSGQSTGGVGGTVGFFNNGNPMAGNFFRLPQPFKWAAVGTAGSDSSLVITCTPQRTITATSTARVAVPVVAMVSPATIEAFTPPANVGDPGTFVDVRWHLVCVAVAKRSVNV